MPNNETIIKKLSMKPEGKINMVLDTDTFNEIDDQFAVCYAMCSKDKLNVKALYAAPFYNQMSENPKDGMEKSYDEIKKLLNSMGMEKDNFVFKGSHRYLGDKNEPCDSPAVRDLIRKAMESDDENPLYVATIGAITNIASAILIEPKIIEKIIVVWLGGHSYQHPHTREFNMFQDKEAANVVFNSSVPLVQIPCAGVASHLITTLYDLKGHLEGKNKMCDNLLNIYEGCSKNHFGYGRVIWDISTIAWLINPSWVRCAFVHSPVVNPNDKYSFDQTRPLISCAYEINRNAIFTDMFNRFVNYEKE